MPLLPNGILDIPTPRVFLPLVTAENKRFYRAKGGRASGKSHWVAEYLVEQAATRQGLRVLCARETQRSLKESAKKLIEDKIQAHGLSHLFTILRDEIRGPGGGSFTFIGLAEHNSETVKGYESVDICWCEEASTLSERSIKLLVPTIRAPNSIIIFTYNPRRRSDPVQRLIPWHDEQRCVSVHANYKDNPFLPKVMLDEANSAKESDEDDYTHTWLGGYETLGSKVVIPLLHIEAAVGLAAKLGIVPTGKRIASLDVAGAEETGDENGFLVRHGIQIEHVEKWNGFDTSMTTTRAVNLSLKYECEELQYDSASVGEGVTGEWAAMGRRNERPKGLQLVAWNGGNSVLEPEARIDPKDPKSKKNKDHYHNLKAQAWFNLRRRFQNAYHASKGMPYDADEIISISEKIDFKIRLQFCDELNQPQHKLSGTGKTLVDKSPDNTHSPNLADPAAQAYTPLSAKSGINYSAWG